MWKVVCFIFYNLLSSLSALDNVSLPLLAKGCRLKEAHHQAADLLEQVGLASRMRHKPGQLSGGEQQRVAIARAVIGQPAMVIADEPTGDLDSTNAAAVAWCDVSMPVLSQVTAAAMWIPITIIVVIWVNVCKYDAFC